MKTLLLKNECTLLPHSTYSICLRGAKQFKTGKYLKLFLDQGDGVSQRIGEAQIVSRKHISFGDLKISDIKDNYYAEARTHESFTASIKNLYRDFDEREIVTLLQFKMNYR